MPNITSKDAAELQSSGERLMKVRKVEEKMKIINWEAKKLSIQKCIQSLMHACHCIDANCRLPSCQKMKRVVIHMKNCKRKRQENGDCPICKQLIALCCYHAKHCQKIKCLIPFCFYIKRKIKQQQLQQRSQQTQLLRFGDEHLQS
ncbi:histone acetyltransferase p300 isoform X2 [Solenopsis invicta]|uniref:histone acetyltransferase p300 isoform X2 n=1 Tax=Solenopsis invicta TaxID=13686 RepID=UPI0005959E3A|nr:histone acetyltransferase p300 isoform X2 [Solenopsis invicta]XP_039313210.1 histone acetyltransferase p300 isoform X2 [Solenopsis invicta]